MTKKYFFFVSAALPLILLGAGCNLWPADDQARIAGTRPQTNSATSPTTDTDIATTPTAATTNENAEIVEVYAGLIVIKTNTGTSTVATKSYTDSLAIYGKSNARFQISNCSGRPGSFTIKKGTKFMVDNRDSVAHTFGIGTQTFKLGAYDYAIITVSKPGTHTITCDGGGAAQVVIQN